MQGGTRMSKRHSAFQAAPPPPRDMLAAGIDIIPDKKINLAAKREKRGECPTCGVQVVKKKKLFGKDEPLTVEGLVFRGQCLTCHPIEGYNRRPPGTGPHGSPFSNINQSHYRHTVLNGQASRRGEMVAPGMDLPAETNGARIEDHMRAQLSARPVAQREPSARQSFSPQVYRDANVPMQHEQGMWQQQQEYLEQGPAFHQGFESGIRVPKELDVGNAADDVSVITMDYRLVQSARGRYAGGRNIEYHSDEEEDPPIPSRRPGPEVFGSQDPFENRTGAPNRSMPSYSENSHRMRTAPTHLPPTKEGTLYSTGDDGFHHSPTTKKEVTPGFDADGYPVSSNGHGWDHGVDILPSGGLDGLFQNRTGENNVSSNAKRRESVNDEIRYEPPPDDSIRFSEISKLTAANRAYSMESGPMLLPDDDGPMLHDVDDQMQMESTNVFHMNGNPDHKMARNPIHYSEEGVLLSRAVSQPSQPSENSSHYASVNGRSPFRKEGDLPASKKSSGTSTTQGPPLVSHDLRGRPDEDSIQDPSMQINAAVTLQNSRHDLVADEAEGGHYADRSFTNGNPEESQQVTHLQYQAETASSSFSQRRHVPLERMSNSSLRSSGPMLMDDQIEIAEFLKVHDAVPSQPPIAEEPSSGSGSSSTAGAPNLKSVPAAEATNDHAIREDGLMEPSNLSSDLIDETFQRLSLTPKDEKSCEDQKPGEAAVKGVQVSIDQMPAVLYCLNMREATPFIKENALRSLAFILWTCGEKGRSFVLSYNGVDSLVKTVWDDMGNARLQDAGAEFLLSLAASVDGHPQNDLLANEDRVCDSLLFAMQTHANVESIQLKGCSIFACLAAASSNNPNISDGSLSGALMMVITAMNNHQESLEIQRAGLQALYLQCISSTNAESNKLSLIESQLDNGQKGLDLILNVFNTPLRDDRTAMTWLCRLLWVLTSNDNVLKSVSRARFIMENTVAICHSNGARQDSGELIEASFGVIANMAHLDSNRTILFDLQIVPIILETMDYHQRELIVNREACSALGNLAGSPYLSAAIFQSEGVDLVLNALNEHMENEGLVCEAFRTLVCLAGRVKESKSIIALPKNIQLILDASSEYQESKHIQEQCCRLLASLSTDGNLAESLVSYGGLDTIIYALESQVCDSVLDASCAALRNLSCQIHESDEMLRRGALKSLIRAMAKNEKLISLQTNGCVSLWSMIYKTTNMEPGALVGDCRGVETIVKAMQNHMESSELLEAACGALWCIVDENIDRQKDALAAGAIDAVVCTFMMHPAAISTLTNACGIFSNLSGAAPLAEAIAHAQGVSVIADAVRNNVTAISFLEVACLTLRNIVTIHPTYADEASAAISTILEAMRNNIDATNFQKEACSLLWVLAAESESCHSKIVALEGISVVVSSLEANRHDPEFEETAKGAFYAISSEH